MSIKEYVLTEQSYITELRRYFHSHPEVSLKEFKTCEKIEKELDLLNIPHKRVGETGIFAWIDGKKSETGKTIALRADIDALAMSDLKNESYRSKNIGVCHACGHDAHTASLLGASKILKSKENEFSGQIRLFFQQAEEIGQGARLFVKEGLLENVDRIFGTHVSSRIESGKIALTSGQQNASCDYFKIDITGKGAHVSTPHLGIDAAYIASQIVVQLQSIVSRNTAPLESVIVGIGVIKAGTQYNIIAENAVIEGTTRSFLQDIRNFTNERVISIAKQTARLYGANAEVTFMEFASPLVNDIQACQEAIRVIEPLIGMESIITDYEKALGADDFADFLAVTKGMYAFIGTANDENENTKSAHHHGLFDIDESSLLLSTNAYVDYALYILAN